MTNHADAITDLEIVKQKLESILASLSGQGQASEHVQRAIWNVENAIKNLGGK